MGEAKRRKALGDYPEKTKSTQSATNVADAVSWEVIGDLAAHPKSGEVVALLEQLKQEHQGSGGKTMVVTLEFPAHTPILKAKVIGMGAFIGLASGLQDLDLVDRLEHATRAENGVDAAFA